MSKIAEFGKSLMNSVLHPADLKVQEARYAVCAKCPLRDWMKVPGFDSVLTCGKPIQGSTIRLKKSKIPIELCGCVMIQKVKDPEATCPVGKW